MCSHMQIGSLERERERDMCSNKQAGRSERCMQPNAGRKFRERERDMCSNMQVGSLEREICAVICR
jgi:hypothetical protein